jgi:xanthine dehydrogenase YagR molybdenum-binding subunit
MPEEISMSTDRVDGRQKVTGAAKYAAEHEVPNLAYAVLATSNIAKGTIKAIDTKTAEKAPGVLSVVSYENMPQLPGYSGANGDTTPFGLKLFGSNKIYFDGQPIAIVVADTYERAVHAASLVKCQYERETPQTDLEKNTAKAAPPKGRKGYTRRQADAYKTAPVNLEASYKMTNEVHNPMELGSITAVWDGTDKLTVYDNTQGVKGSQQTYARLLGLQRDNVHVISPFVGGGFGMALRTWPYQVAAVVAAKQAGRPVKLMLTRMQMFNNVGYRPYTTQTIGVGASADGQLVGLTHKATAATSSYEEFTEGVVNMTQFMYACPNVNTDYTIVPLDVSTPTWMRGPGEATGAFALESALDEIAYKLNMDPLELRVKNYAETDPERNLPWSSNNLKECYRLGAEKIGWKNRQATPRNNRDNGWLVGYGMSNGVFGAFRSAATAKIQLMANGKVVIQSAASDIGPGTGTAMVNIASEVLGIPTSQITFELGDSNLPQAPTQGGSGTVSAVGSAVYDVCKALQEKLAQTAAAKDGSPYKGVAADGLSFKNGMMRLKDGSNPVSYTDILQQANLPQLEITRESKGGNERQQFSMYSFSVHFTKVHVHPTTGVVRVKHAVTVGDAGKIISLKTAESQMIGGVTGGIGMALMEEALYDHRYGRYVNNNLADYHVPVNADVPQIDVIFINQPDYHVNPIGAKGMGEIALIGYAASVANAVFNATGKRVRDLPITCDKVLG